MKLMRGIGVVVALAVSGVGLGLPGSTVGCGGCDFAEECADKEGVTEASASNDGENRYVCEARASFLTMYSGVNLEITSRSAFWHEGEGENRMCSCSVENGVLVSCSVSDPGAP